MFLPSSYVLLIMSIGSSHLFMRDRQILVLIGGKLSRCVDTAVVGLLEIIAVDHLFRFTPAYEVEETLGLHGEFQTALHLHLGECVGVVGIGFDASIAVLRAARLRIWLTIAIASASRPSCAKASARISSTSA